MDEKGLLVGSPGEWAVLCGRCEDMGRRSGHNYHQIDVPPPAVRIDKPPSNAHHRIWLRLYGIRDHCHSCVDEVAFAAGVFPVTPARSFNLLVLSTTDSACRLVKHLLERARVATELVDALTPKQIPSLDGEILAVRCPQCGAPPLGDSNLLMREAVATRGQLGLGSVASADCSVVKWHRALYAPERALARL
ncbi:hypothetical protein ACWF82_02960 [Nocardia sp. NPDC055053]